MSFSFAQMALVAGTLIGLTTAYLGLFVVLRRVVFVGASLAQLASAGVALSLFLDWPLGLGAAFTLLCGVGLFSLEGARRRLPGEALIGVAYSAAGAAAILLIAKAPHGEAEIMDLIFGNILGVSPSELGWMLGIFSVVGLIHLLFAKEFVLMAFDPETARTLGYRVGLWNLLFYLTLAASIGVAIHAAGVLLVFSYLVFPPLVGLLLASRWRSVALVSLATATAATLLGTWASLRWDLPTGAAIVATCFGSFALASLARRLLG